MLVSLLASDFQSPAPKYPLSNFEAASDVSFELQDAVSSLFRLSAIIERERDPCGCI